MNKPIGVFDSGLGGLTVLREVIRELPGEAYVYFGDTARVPYGGKSRETITRFSIENTRFLLSFDVKMCVVACHTASSLALKELQEKFSLQFVGMIEPAACRALAATKTGRIGVIGTKATIASGAYETCLKGLDASVKVYSTACPLFVPLVEEGWLSGEIVEKAARIYLEPLKSFDIDTLILGCTHYPVLSETIGGVLGGGVTLVNPAMEAARETRELVRRLSIGSEETPAPGRARFFVSDEPEHFRRLGERFFGEPIGSVVKVSVDAPAERVDAALQGRVKSGR